MLSGFERESSMVFRPSVSHHLFIKCTFLGLAPDSLRILAVASESAFKIRATGLRASSREYALGSSSRPSMLEIRTKKLPKIGGFTKFCFYAPSVYVIIRCQSSKQAHPAQHE